MSEERAEAPAVVSPATNGAAPRPPEPPAEPGSAYAGLATRVIACAADVLLIQAVTWMVGAIAAVAASMLGLSGDLRAALIALGGLAATVWWVSYFVFFWSATGQTPGNRLMQIRVQDAVDGRPLSLRRALLRVPAALLSALLLFAGYLMILVDSRRRALHDRLVRSVVVYAPTGAPRRRG